MSGISQYQSVFRIAKHDATPTHAQTQVARRNRPQVSCAPCRSRKLKCDRQNPCTPCSKRSHEASCSYGNRVRNGHEHRSDASKMSEAQLRLRKLEEMVNNLINKNVNTPTDSTHNTPYHTEDFSTCDPPNASQASLVGHLDVDGLETNYLGATHWTTILESIRDIQTFLEPATDRLEDDVQSSLPHAPDPLFDTLHPLTLADVCGALPSRLVTDKLLSVYFNTKYLQLPIIHGKKFLREYASFGVDPTSVSFLWISMLFSVLWIACQFSPSCNQEVVDSLCDRAGSSFDIKAGQALVTGQYHKAKPYAVEAVLLYAQCKYLQREDPNAQAWMIAGISTRLALRMGYHRDPRHFPTISPFEGEMRRRSFFTVEMFDLLLSFQAGLPAIIHEEECDTEPPRNLSDEDFDEDCKILPASRPLTEPTPMLYFCHKSRFSTIFKRVVRHALSMKPPSFEITMQLEKDLRETHTGVPASLRMKPLATLISDQAYMVLNRLTLELMYLKSLCILHRNYVNHDRLTPRFAHSRMTCIDAALKIMRYQADLYLISQPGGQFYNDRLMLGSLTMQDFLLAAMVTALDLLEACRNSPTAASEEVEAQADQYDALQVSYKIWTSRRAFSRDARRASNVLAVMLSKIEKLRPVPSTIDTTKPLHSASNSSVVMEDLLPSLKLSSENSARSVSARNVADIYVLGECDAGMVDFDATVSLNMLFNSSTTGDWGFADQYLIDTNFIGDYSQDWTFPAPGLSDTDP